MMRLWVEMNTIPKDTVTGSLDILRLDDNIISGTFDFQLQRSRNRENNPSY